MAVKKLIIQTMTDAQLDEFKAEVSIMKGLKVISCQRGFFFFLFVPSDFCDAVAFVSHPLISRAHTYVIEGAPKRGDLFGCRGPCDRAGDCDRVLCWWLSLRVDFQPGPAARCGRANRDFRRWDWSRGWVRLCECVYLFFFGGGEGVKSCCCLCLLECLRAEFLCVCWSVCELRVCVVRLLIIRWIGYDDV